MKKSLYYRTVMKRDSQIKVFIRDFFSYFSAWFRLLLEVFIRKNFGERYFKLSAVIVCTFCLALLPPILHALSGFVTWLVTSVQPQARFSRVQTAPPIQASFWQNYFSWYLFLAAFVTVSIRHWRDKQHNPSVYDFARLSTYTGDIHRFFFSIKIGGKKPNIRQVETLLEPLPFFILGIVLWLIGQKVGILLTIASLSYSLCYVLAYLEGDDFVMDRIDEMIFNANLEKAFVDDADESETKGLRFVGRKPADANNRRKILPYMMDEKDEAIEAK